MQPVYLTNKEIAALTGLKVRGLTEKADRQKWPFEEEKGHGGQAPRIYQIATLPDDIQVKWVEDIIEKRSKEKLAFAKILPLRESYYDNPKAKTKHYDGKSYGLCRQAAELLIGINIQELCADSGQANTPLTVLACAPSLICPHCYYGKYKEKTEKTSEPETPKYCLYCGTKLIDRCPTCGVELCLPDQNFCENGHQLRKDQALPDYAKKGK